MPGTVTHLFLCGAKGVPLTPVGEVRAVSRLGLDGDRHQKEDAPNQLLLIDEETLGEFDVPPGALRENIVTRGIDVQRIPYGTRLRLGEVEIELTKACTPCKLLEGIRPGLLKAMVGRRGVHARVLGTGTIRVGDAVEP